jgi:uncharacterized protein YkwD
MTALRSLRHLATLALVAGLAARAAAQAPTALERGILAESNLARTDPAGYAAHLERLLPWFDGAVLRRPGTTVGLRTNEGAAAVREAIAFLRRQKPVPALAWSGGLWRAARDHAADQGRSGGMGHTGADGSTVDQRLRRHGRWLESAAENIDYGSDSARDVVISLIVDDGVAGRGHRTNIFNPALRVLGAACGPHPRYRQLCVIDYAGGFEERAR